MADSLIGGVTAARRALPVRTPQDQKTKDGTDRVQIETDQATIRDTPVERARVRSSDAGNLDDSSASPNASLLADESIGRFLATGHLYRAIGNLIGGALQ